MGAFIGVFLTVAVASGVFIYVIASFVSKQNKDATVIDPLPEGNIEESKK